MVQFADKSFKIKSRDNQKLKFARSVRDGREREKIFIEGLRLCEELVNTDARIHSVFFTAKFAESRRGQEILKLLLTKKLELFETDEKAFDSLADTKQAQGIAIIAGTPLTGRKILEKALSKANPLLILLHQVNNPTNLGAILRTAEAVGVNGIITTRNTTDVFSAKALRGAMGASLRLPCWTNADFFEALQWTAARNIKSICADIKSETSYLDVDWKIPRLLIVGSEGHGLTGEEINAAHESLVIPMENSVESLNVAVASGIILFEAKRQRHT